MKRIAVVDFDMGNIHSMLKALRLYHEDVVFTADPDRLRQADAIVLPGDGAFAAAMHNLTFSGQDEVIRNHIADGRPLLGVCIGFQVLFENSDERDSVTATSGELIRGLNLIPGEVRRFDLERKFSIPHMGWNRLENKTNRSDEYLSEYMYFIHSYRAQNVPEQYVVATCEYGGDHFPAMVQKENIVATQFHPEKSDRWGLQLIEDWVGSI